jgi:pre-mRNA branch site protein p14
MLCARPPACLPASFWVCSGTEKGSRGTAYVVYEDIYDAKQALEHLGGFNVQNRYLILQYYNPTKMNKKADLKQKEEQLRAMQERHGVDGEQHAREK